MSEEVKPELEPGEDNCNVKYRVDEKTMGPIHDTMALAMAKEVARSLNMLLKIPANYRDYKKDPKDKLERVFNYLIKKATTPADQVVQVPMDESHLVIKTSYHLDINKMVLERRKLSAIQQMLFEKHEAVVPGGALHSYITRFKKTNEYLKHSAEWINELDDIRIYHKKGRLSELEELYIDAFKRWKQSPSRQGVDQCLKILEQARKETMPIVHQNFQFNQNNIHANIITNILAKEEEMIMLDKLPLHEIIIGKVAAKYHRDPYLLQRRLQNSYYAIQAGAHGLDRISEPIQYPTAILYSVEKLGSKWKEIQAEEAQVVQEANVMEKIKQSPSEIKEALLKRVREKKGPATEPEKGETTQ